MRRALYLNPLSEAAVDGAAPDERPRAHQRGVSAGHQDAVQPPELRRGAPPALWTATKRSRQAPSDGRMGRPAARRGSEDRIECSRRMVMLRTFPPLGRHDLVLT